MKRFVYLMVFIFLTNFVYLRSQWVKISDIYAVDFAVQGDTLLATSLNGNIYFSPNNGVTWVINKFIYGNTGSIFLFNHNIFISNLNGLYISRDFGQTWFDANLTFNNSRCFEVYPIQNYKSRIWVGTVFTGFFYSDDSGSNWNHLKDSEGFSDYESSIYSEDSLIIIKNGKGYFLSNNMGTNWSYLSNFFQHSDHVSPNAFIYTDSTIFSQQRVFLYTSRNFGTDWKLVHDFQKDSLIIIELYKCGNNFFALTEQHGFLTSSDSGRSWTPMNNGLEHLFGREVPIKTNSKYIFICMGGYNGSGYSGIYRAKYDSCTINEPNKIIENYNTKDFSLSPNPTADFLEISVGATGIRPEQNIEIISVLGTRLLSTSVNLTPTLSMLGEGVRIDLSSLPQGIYFVKVGDRVGKFVKI